MVVHRMVMQIGSSGFLPGREDAACLRDGIGLLDGNSLMPALPMLMFFESWCW